MGSADPIVSAPATAQPTARSTVSWWSRLRGDSRAPWVALAVVIAIGTLQTAIRFHNNHLGLLGDDYDFLLARHGITGHTLLEPHNEHLVAFGFLLYRTIFAFVGIQTAVPYIALLLVSVCACAVLSYVFIKRELGPWLALIAPLLLLTLGPAAEALLWPFEFVLFTALALWLGAMLLLERDQPLTDGIGCALLILGVGTESIAVVLLPATALALVLWRGWRRAWRQAWIVAVPLILYVAWYVAYQPHGERGLASAPGFVVNSFEATVAALSGVGNHAPYDALLAVALIVAVAARCLYLRRLPTTTAYMGVGLLLVWLAAGISEGPGRTPLTSRYQFQNVVLMMLALTPLAPSPSWTQASRARLVGAPFCGALVAVIVALNVGRYGRWEEIFHYQESVANAELAAVQIARPAIANPGPFTTRSEAGLYWPFAAQAFLEAIDAHGSPVNIHRDLELASPVTRARADVVLVDLEEVQFARGAATATVPPRTVSGTPLRPAGPGCAVIAAGTAREGLELVAPPGGLIIHPAAGPPVSVGVARFSDPPEVVELAPVRGGGESERRTALDASSVPWRFRLTAPQAITVCSAR